MPCSKMEGELKVGCHHLCSCWPGAFLALPCCAAGAWIASAVLLLVGGRSVPPREPMCQEGFVRDHLFLKENSESWHLRAMNEEGGECF